jgi:DNA helicase-2/ATP-dependent DNA helicase PcrA
MAFVPSPRQSAIAEKMAQPGNILVQACAGSGKTTTMVWLAGMIPAHMRVLALSFNKSIADELSTRMPAHVRSATMHSVGFGMVRKAQKSVRLDDKKLLNIIDTHPGIVIHQNGTRATIVSDLLAIVPLAQDCMADCGNVQVLSALAEVAGRTLEMPDKSLPLVASIVAASDKMQKTITFAEMIRHPVVHNYPSDYFDVVMVDEAQDLNSSQHELLKKLVRPGSGKLLAVGDRFQSIYGFRGADPRSMDRLKLEWNMTELPLDVSYRCAAKIIEAAQTIVGVETIKPKAAAPEGTIGLATLAELPTLAQEGDMVLCRINAPLVPCALKMLKQGKKAIIRGRDIGATLAALVRRSKVATVPALLAWIVGWRDDKSEKARAAKKSDAAIEAIHDQADTLTAIAEECADPAEVLCRLSELFADDKRGITLSTVHKAKGLESETVFILGPELLPAPWAKSPQEQEQERNIKYVATTRAMRTLINVPLPPRKGKAD